MRDEEEFRMMRDSRRDFLKRTAMAGGAMALGPLGVSAAQEKPLDMVIMRFNGGQGGPVDDDATVDARAKKMTETAIETLGGMNRFMKKGDSVWILPNIAWDRIPAQAANTNPALVATLVKLCLDAGAKNVKVGCNPCNDAVKAYPRSGIENAVKQAGGDTVYLDPERYKDYDINGKRLRKWPLYPEIVESDLVINVPIVKHHSMARVTVCMKNYMGVSGGNRGQWHQDMPACLCDITAFMKPSLAIVDATRILTNNGPTGGNLADVKRLDTIAAGTDIVALDAFAVGLLGHKPEEIATVAAGQAEGLGKMDYRSELGLKEIDLA